MFAWFNAIESQTLSIDWCAEQTKTTHVFTSVNNRTGSDIKRSRKQQQKRNIKVKLDLEPPKSVEVSPVTDTALDELSPKITHPWKEFES